MEKFKVNMFIKIHPATVLEILHESILLPCVLIKKKSSIEPVNTFNVGSVYDFVSA